MLQTGMRYLIIHIVLVTCFGCTHSSSGPSSESELNSIRDKGDVSKYFLSDIPNWMNFSRSGKCKRSQSIRYIDFKAFRNSFSMSYEKAVQFQYLFNKEYQRKREIYNRSYITPQAEKKLFFSVLDKIRADIVEFRLPKFKRVNLFWIDPLLKKGGKKIIERVMKRTDMNKGHPIFVSMCLSGLELEKLVSDTNTTASVRLISSEMFSIYGIENKYNYEMGLNIKDILTTEFQVYFYLIGERVPENLIGDFKIIKLDGEVYEKFY